MAQLPEKILFEFESEDRQVWLIEVKKLGLPKNAPKGQVYSWRLFLAGDRTNFDVLQFVSGSDGLRVFDNAQLSFTQTHGMLVFSAADRPAISLLRNP